MRVKWDSGSENNYRVGADGSFDLMLDSLSLVPGEVLRSAELGIRVRRGPDWSWGNQDGGGLGTTEAGTDTPGRVMVRWDHDGFRESYRVGAWGKYDLMVAEGDGAAVGSIRVGSRVKFIQDSTETDFTGCPGASSSFSVGWTQVVREVRGGWFTTERHESQWVPLSAVRLATAPGQVLRSAEFGIRVRRGPDWNWGDQDRGGLGTTEHGSPAGWLRVRWDHDGSTNGYRVGQDGKYDLLVAEEEGAVRPGAPTSGQTFNRPQFDAGHDEEWLDPAEATNMQCAICLCIARDALAHDCGNLFCEVCWTKWCETNRSCPVCREDGNTVVKAPRDQRKILNLMIKCPLGCEETFRLGDKEVHMAQCAKRKLRCGQCGEEILAELIAAHQKENGFHCEMGCRKKHPKHRSVCNYMLFHSSFGFCHTSRQRNQAKAQLSFKGMKPKAYSPISKGLFKSQSLVGL